jgi:hypothetical protein
MGYCAECGGSISDGSAFCAECGSPVRPAQQAPVEVPEPEPAAAPAISPPAPPAVLGWLRTRWARIAWRTCLALALVGAGIIVGWGAGAERSAVDAEPTPKPGDPASASSAADPDALSMPDVRGLSADQARQVLADAGVRAEVVALSDLPAAGESGIVLVQDPVYGYPVEGSVTLSVSRAARVPVVAGRSATDVLADLDELGAQVKTVSRYVPGVAPGNVAAIKPAAGTPLPDAVTVTVASQPDELSLNQVEAFEDSCWTNDDSMNGVDHTEMYTCETDSEPVQQGWIVNRSAQRLRGVVGIPDSSSPGDRMTLEVLGDGVVLSTVQAEYGATSPLDVDVAGVLRLTMRVRSTTDEYGTIGLADLVLVGDQRRLSKLDTW